LEEFALRLRQPPDKKPWPRRAVEDHFRRFLECGIMRFGAARYRCPRCGDDLFLAFSCKLRLCPSCNAKRAFLAVANALDRLLPEVPHRQWVLVVPKRLRFFMNREPELPGELSAIFARSIDLFLKSRAQGGGAPAQLHFVQRTGAALNLHVHVHAVVSEGLFDLAPGALGVDKLIFRRTAPPSDDDVVRLTESNPCAARCSDASGGWAPCLTGLPRRCWLGVIRAFPFTPKSSSGAEIARGLSACSPIAPGRDFPRGGAPKRNVVVYRGEGREGKGLSLAFEPVDFLRRWGLLAPPRYRNLVRYYGALGPKSPLRPALVAKASRGAAAARLRKKGEELGRAAGERVKSWASCIARLLEIDPLVCRRCGTKMVLLAAIMDVQGITRILEHLNLPTEWPKTAPARSVPPAARDGPEDSQGPSDEGCQLDAQADLYDGKDCPAAED
jgi:hypothetical protein